MSTTTLNRILDTAADNLRIAKVLVQLGLDPNNVTHDTIFNRLLEIMLANITLANMFAIVGAIFFVATLLTQKMVPQRVANMIGCTFFVSFGALAGDVKTFLRISCCCPSMPFASVKCSPSSRRRVAQRRAIRRWNGSSRS